MRLNKYITIPGIIFLFLFSSCEDSILGPDAENTPANNFNILWQQFDRYYPSFIIKNVNWDSLRSVNLSLITPQTSDLDLWRIIGNMLSNFDDVHVYMYNRDHSNFFFYSREQEGHSIHEFSLPLVQETYLNNRYQLAGEGNFVYGRLPGDTIGYIYISNFSGDVSWPGDIDKIITQLSGVKNLIVDIRNNLGGLYDNFHYIAAGFVNSPVTYLKQMTRSGPGHNDLTAPVELSVSPRSINTHYNGKIILMTNRFSASAAETFALVIKYLPNTIQIGDSTAGGLGFSNRWFELPNGWTYHMPTSLSFTVDGRCLESIGIAPDIYVRNTRSEIYSGTDMQLEYVLNYLKTH